MRIMCVDDEELILRMTVSLCEDLPQTDDVVGFTDPREALEWLEDGQSVDLALLDIDMPDMDGLILATKIKEIWPDTAIIFLTGYSEFAVQAFAIHADGYLLKPIDRQSLSDEMDWAMGLGRGSSSPRGRIQVRTFGNFEISVEGQIVAFTRAKAKELLAYLIDRQGSGVTRAEIFATLWEEGEYDRAMQKQLDVIIRSLRASLEEYGIEEIFEMNRGLIRICPEKVDCDLYRFLGGDMNAVNSFRGEYMNGYSWAEFTEGYISSTKEA